MIGTKLGPYEVLAKLGQGGMGEVYRARDTKLGREVAIKVVSGSLTYDPERLARFEREAQLLASLNHPHIATVHGLEQSGGTQCLVMELVEGETLAARLRTGALPEAEALRLARQIADALQAAHDKGIVHRDLKPANIALTAEGQVKVLDFGLAKALETNELDVSLSPTLSIAATQAGMILGTAAYMAPEQAKGRPVDKRADLWAFGCVVYEMLTGRRAFDGEDITEIIAAVVRGEPQWSALPADLPAPVRLLLRRCLEKDRQRRIADAGAALFVLDELAGLTPPPSSVPAPPDAAMPPPWRRMVPVAAAMAVAAALTGTASWTLLRGDPSPVVRTAIATDGETAPVITGFDRDLAITADGSHVIYVGSGGRIAVRRLDQFEPRTIGTFPNTQGVFASPDGQWVGFFDGLLLRKVALTGGPAVTVATMDTTASRGGTWGPDDTIVFATNLVSSGLFRVSASGGELTVLTTPDRSRGESDHLWPEFLPGGRAILFTIAPLGSAIENAQVAVLDLRSGEKKVLIRGGSHASYVAPGYLMHGVSGTLRAVPFDLDRLEVTGAAVPVLEGVAMTSQGGVNAAAAANGTLVYMPGGAGSGSLRSLVWVDRSGREEDTGAPQRGYQYPRISPDGTRVALDVRDQENDIWIWEFARRTLTRLTFDPANDVFPVWSADGHRVFFASQRSGATGLHVQPADGTGRVERLIDKADIQQLPTSAAPDGSAVVVRETNPKTAIDLVLLPLKPPYKLQPLIASAFNETNAEVSPNGRWLVYQSDESGSLEIYVRPFPGIDHGRWQVSTAGGRQPLWSRNGRELFYLGADNALMAVPVEDGASWRAGNAVKVGGGDDYLALTTNAGRVYDVSPDGRRFLRIKSATARVAAAPQSLLVVQNWARELERVVGR